MEYRARLTYSHLLNEAAVDELLNGLQARAGDLGPVVSVNTAAPSFTVTLAMDADDMGSALAHASAVTTSALGKLGLHLEASAAEVEPVAQHEPAAA